MRVSRLLIVLGFVMIIALNIISIGHIIAGDEAAAPLGQKP